MAFTNEILFSALVGSKVADSIPRFKVVQNELEKQVLPPIPFIGRLNEVDVSKNSMQITSRNWQRTEPNIDNQFFPLSFRRKIKGEPWYTLPFEPLISISGKNEIIKRKVAKNVDFIGTIKERWSQDDFSITITGTLIGVNDRGTVQDTFPREDFEQLRDYLFAPEGIEVNCEPLQLLGINAIVVEDVTFPFTKGENVQAYEIKALSDFTAEFLLEIEE